MQPTARKPRVKWKRDKPQSGERFVLRNIRYTGKRSQVHEGLSDLKQEDRVCGPVCNSVSNPSLEV